MNKQEEKIRDLYRELSHIEDTFAYMLNNRRGLPKSSINLIRAEAYDTIKKICGEFEKLEGWSDK